MIVDVAFDAPLTHPFSYRVPAGWTITPGQRVIAPLRGAIRAGLVLGLRDGDGQGLHALLRLAEPGPVLDADGLSLVRWIAEQSLSSIGSTAAALLPPMGGAPITGDAPRRPPARSTAEVAGIPTPVTPASATEILVGGGRERRLLERIAVGGPPALVVTADVEAAARWAQRLEKIGPTIRLDSGASDADRARGWARLAAGEVGLGVGTRSALLAPLPVGAMLALVDEHEVSHRPPGHPRIHTREVILERSRRGPLRAVLTAATPSLEVWRRAEQGLATLVRPAPAPWPAVTVADTRGILRREALTPPLARALRETLAAGHRSLLLIGRLTSALACDDCGVISRCERCLVALAYSQAARTLTCRLCGDASPLPDTCPTCHGRRLSPFGWGAERVEHAVRRRFPKARVVRYDPDATRRARGEAQRAAAAAADVVVGTRGALRLFGPGSLGMAALVSPDQFLRLPDFRASERLFALAWAAVERVRPDGAVVVQSQTPAHHVFEAVAHQKLTTFYAPELEFRREAGFPPFRRLVVVTARAGEPPDTQRIADAVFAALRGIPGLTVYPPISDRTTRQRRIVVKGPDDLPERIAPALADFRTPRPRRHGIIEVEVDPVEWQF